MSETVQRPRVQLAYVGPCEIKGKKQGSLWQVVETPDVHRLHNQILHGDKRVYSKATAKGVQVGSIHSFEYDPENPTAIYPNTRRFVDHVFPALRLEWETAADEAKREKDAKSIPDAHKELLAPLREEYRKRIGYAARAAYIAKVLTYITG